jgi:hypothetical protein
VGAFVLVGQMEAALQRSLIPGAAAESLEEACQIVRDYLEQRLDVVADETIKLHGTGRPTLLLPELPVTEVSAVLVEGTALTPADWSLDGEDGILWRIGDYWPAGIANVTVTYDHGFASVPASIRGIVISLANRLYHQHPAVPGLRSEQLAAYSYTRDDTGAAGLNGLERLVLDRHKQRRIPVA